MVDRVVLGSSSLAHTFVESLVDRRGTLQVVTTDESRAETLLDDGIAVTVGDPSDDGTLRELENPDVLLVAGDDPDRNVAVAQAARRIFPDALLVAYAGVGGTEQASILQDIADKVIDPTAVTAGFLIERIGDRGIQMRQLRRVIQGIDRLAIVTHDNPDPDAIGSAVALSQVAEAVGCESEVCYYGDITHQENRAFVNLLGFELRNLGPDENLDEFDGIALVDHSGPGVNNQLPETTEIDVVIDHHPPRGPVDAEFVDLRSDVGATSTLLVEYLERFNVGFDEDIATGLLFGIRVDTQEFTREASKADFEAAATLLPHAELGTLERIESPSISPETFDTIANAIWNKEREGQVIMSCVGQLSDRDALAQAADRLLTMEDVTTTLVYGIRDETIYVSARSRGTEVDLGEILREAFAPIGSAGGHADMAGAQIRLGVLESVDDRKESLLEIVESVITNRFLEALETSSGLTLTGVRPDEYDPRKYLAPDEELATNEDE
jgi:nanoRNase/pAp phosphatase (c-di-AMP/oligoRNAs hydrolase)